MTKEFAITAGLFDFTDTEGVPAEVAEAVNKARVGGLNEELYSAIVAVVNGAPQTLSIKQVVFVLHKLGLEVPAENTVRSYLNRAETNGDISKPTRQTYGAAGAAVEAGAPDTSVAEPEEVEADLDDPLADL